MKRAEFLKNFEKHVRKSKKEHDSGEGMLERLRSYCCPLPKCPPLCGCLNLLKKRCELPREGCPVSKIWPLQSLYYEMHKRGSSLIPQMISIVKKVYKI